MNTSLTDYRPCVAQRGMDSARAALMYREKQPMRVQWPNYWRTCAREAEDAVIAAADWLIAASGSVR